MTHHKKISDWFSRGAHKTSHILGSWYAFFGAFLVVLVWAICGPYFKFSDTWQMIINTSTTIVTFLMVFLLQNTQNHDSKAIHIKLDEIIQSQRRADNKMIGIQEDASEDELEKIAQKHKTLKEKSCEEDPTQEECQEGKSNGI